MKNSLMTLAAGTDYSGQLTLAGLPALCWQRHRHWLCIAIVASAAFVAVPSVAQAEPRSIQEFMSFKDKWDNFALTGYVWNLEGRYGLISDGNLNFTHCPLPFRITQEQENNRGTTGVVEVTGKIIAEKKGLVFIVEKLAPRPRDVERVRQLRLGINSQQANEWYSTANWTRERGQYYNDKDLFAAAIDLDRHGILAELRQIKTNDEAAYEALIQKARSKNLDQQLLQQITHDALQARFANLQKQTFSENAYRDLTIRMQKELEGSSNPLPSIPQEQNTAYLLNPNSVYAAANAEQRQLFNRLFAVHVISTRIEKSAQPDGSNGFEIADRLKNEVPERQDLFENYESLALAWNQARIAVMTRSQLVDVTQRLEQRGKADLALKFKKDWLVARDPLYRQEGARGLADLAQQWLFLLKDEEQAVELYIAAWRENPQYAPAIEWLKTRGYQQHQDTWMLESEIAKMPLSPLELAIREGRVENGMTATQVQSALGIAPSSVTRMASRKQVTEWWVFQEAGIIIQLAKGNREKEASVVKVEKLPAW